MVKLLHHSATYPTLVVLVFVVLVVFLILFKWLMESICCMLQGHLVWLHIIFNLSGESAFETPKSNKYMTIFFMHF